MNPSTRRRATLLLWLMLALLPLRSWALAGMDVQRLAAPAMASAPASCHEAGREAGEDASHAHAQCSLCHAAVAPASALPVLAVDEAASRAVAGVTRGRQDVRPSDLYKPPRI